MSINEVNVQGINAQSFRANSGNEKVSTKPEENKQDSGKLVLALAALGAAGAAFVLTRGKVKKLKGIKFDKGIAYLKNGKKFSGIIEDTLKNGKKIKLQYKDGKILTSTINDKLSKAFLYDVGKAKGVKTNVIRKFDESGKVIENIHHSIKTNTKGSQLIIKKYAPKSNETLTGKLIVNNPPINIKKAAEKVVEETAK